LIDGLTHKDPLPFPLVPLIQPAPSSTFPSSTRYDSVLTDEYCAPAVTVPVAAGRRGLTGAAGVEWADREGAAHRALAVTPLEACYTACYNFYAPPPNNDQFFFQLVEVSGVQACQCCKTCETRVAQQGAVVMAACAPTNTLRLGPSVSHRVVKASGTKPLTVTYTLRVKGTSKHLRLTDMGIHVTLPAGATVKKALPASGSRRAGGAHVNVAADGVTWHPLTLAGTKTWTFKVKATLARPFIGASAGSLRFRAQVFQNAVGPAAAPYCPVPAREAVVSVKYP
jgi:hypothetical protein